jgi:hypothetical protein
MWIFCYHSRGPAGDLGSGKWKGKSGMEQKDQPRIYWSSYLYRRVVLLVDRIYSNEDYDNK